MKYETDGWITREDIKKKWSSKLVSRGESTRGKYNGGPGVGRKREKSRLSGGEDVLSEEHQQKRQEIAIEVIYLFL